jgi:aldose sugar dehydrogenase
MPFLLSVLLVLIWPTSLLSQRPTDPPGQVPKDVQIRLTTITNDLASPWSLAFLPNGDILVTEEPGSLRLIRDNALLPTLVPGAPEVALGLSGLMEVFLHPQYSTNRFVYLTYLKEGPRPNGEGTWSTTALARGKFDGERLTDVVDIFLADAWAAINSGGDASRAVFGPDGKIYLGISHRNVHAGPQDLSLHFGKILRLNDDGSIPTDNPFLTVPLARPEIFSYGHRTIMGLYFHPMTGELWQTENGPLGGDEVNIIRAGENYGWPVVSYGRDYSGRAISERPWQEGMTDPILHWSPSITSSGALIYDGNEFPEWQGNLFVGSMIVGRIAGTGHLQRVLFNDLGEQARERLLEDLHQRIRFVAQDSQGLLYILSDEGSLIMIEREK